MHVTQGDKHMEDLQYKMAWTKAKTEEIAKWIDTHYQCEFSKKLKIRVRRDGRSWGGRRRDVPFVSISVGNCMRGIFQEYKIVQNHNEIGSIEGDWKRYMAALICHELAHAIQYGLPESLKKSRHDNVKYSYLVTWDRRLNGHDITWQLPYLILRRKFVNDVEIKDPKNIKISKTVSKIKKDRNATITVVPAKTSCGQRASIYMHQDKKIAYGYKTWTGAYRIYFLDVKGDIYAEDTILNGRGARKFIRQYLGIE
jgi:hypothetical protein